MKDLLLPALGCLTLGLAPFRPMPHFFEKLQWLAAGRSFAAIDVFDLFMHGAPWLWLLVTVALVARSHMRRESSVATKGA